MHFGRCWNLGDIALLKFKSTKFVAGMLKTGVGLLGLVIVGISSIVIFNSLSKQKDDLNNNHKSETEKPRTTTNQSKLALKVVDLSKFFQKDINTDAYAQECLAV